ncbi:heavy metal-responsive transcriptional regulator [Streptomyces sp. NBC_01381]|uniref:heavy metal-responsive transcriptional regulator n=1 Tax=Streptomyces sp. NBC_01381 TaxID=2903845 RepID=UPI00225754BA|nr:heavy metal-responsive transcriptional regulator [Streptomyces sp. NBC_01381]MCX4672668.1 heavy metal-responsive transcriptional regulator [Streptomyces sp. NBC_01381]
MRIGELATASGVTTKTVRFYEQAGLVPEPPRTSSGYRDYPGESLTRLAFIRDAQHAGLTLAEIRGILALRDSGQAPCDHVSELIDEHLEEIDRRISELRKTRTALRGLAERAADTDPASCTDTDICRLISRPRVP